MLAQRPVGEVAKGDGVQQFDKVSSVTMHVQSLSGRRATMFCQLAQ